MRLGTADPPMQPSLALLPRATSRCWQSAWEPSRVISTQKWQLRFLPIGPGLKTSLSLDAAVALSSVSPVLCLSLLFPSNQDVNLADWRCARRNTGDVASPETMCPLSEDTPPPPLWLALSSSSWAQFLAQVYLLSHCSREDQRAS